MSLRSTDTRWGALNTLFHWTMFLLVVAIYVAVNVAEGQPRGSDERTWWMIAHRSLGVTALCLMLVWLVVRQWSGRPHPHGSVWQVRLATLTHWGMILLILGLPTAGLLMSQLLGRPVNIYGLFEIPVVLPENERLGRMIYEAHKHIAAPLLAALILLHLVGALWHHLVDRDDTLKRMFR